MKIAMITASPKPIGSASHTLLSELRKHLPSYCEATDIKIHSPHMSEETISLLSSCDAWVFAFPLYVDAVPSHLLSCLIELERLGISGKKVYAVINCGFYEGRQTEPAFMMLKNWCKKSGNAWISGMGVGCGAAMAMLQAFRPGHPLRKPVDDSISLLASLVDRTEAHPESFCSFGFPRAAYQAIAFVHWRNRIRKNGRKPKDLYNKPM